MSGHFFDTGRPTGKWVCIQCRRACKSVGVAAPRCAVCGGVLLFAGKEFHAPRQADLRQWRKVEALLQSGVVFNNRRLGEACPPQHLSQLSDFLSERLERKAGALHLSQQARAGARAKQQKRERKRNRRAIQKQQLDRLIEREARAAERAYGGS